jgi:hypothetical protein
MDSSFRQRQEYRRGARECEENHSLPRQAAVVLAEARVKKAMTYQK